MHNNNAVVYKEELETLQAIFGDELKVTHNTTATTVVRDTPSTCLEIYLTPRTDKLATNDVVFVAISVLFSLDSQKYPQLPPHIELRSTRGLDESATKGITSKLRQKAKELIGSPMLFELIEYTRDLLTEDNKPHEDCPICLLAFEDNVVDFVKTPCFHYFHEECFSSYCQVFTGDLRCPVCRYLLGAEFLNQFGLNNIPKSTEIVESPVDDPSTALSPPQPSRYVYLSNLGNERKIDWNNIFTKVLLRAVATFLDIPHAYAAVINTHGNSINGQKFICRIATDDEISLLETQQHNQAQVDAETEPRIAQYSTVQEIAADPSISKADVDNTLSVTTKVSVETTQIHEANKFDKSQRKPKQNHQLKTSTVPSPTPNPNRNRNNNHQHNNTATKEKAGYRNHHISRGRSNVHKEKKSSVNGDQNSSITTSTAHS